MDASILAAEICLRDAWPPVEHEEVSGWQLRAISGGYNRANSVWPGVFTEVFSLDEAIDRAEAFYRKRNLPPRFQMLRTAEPADLDEALAKRGYASEIECSVLQKPVTPVAMPAEVAFGNQPTPGWLDLYVANQPPQRAAEYRYILVRVPPSRAFLTAKRAGEAVATALAVRVGTDVAVDCVLSHPDHRRAGGATAVMRAAEAWAAGQGARRLILSVVHDNAAAMGLYRKLGYGPLSGYHYRVLRAG